MRANDIARTPLWDERLPHRFCIRARAERQGPRDGPTAMWRALYCCLGLLAFPALAAGPDITRVARVIVAETNQAREDAGRDALVPNVKLVRIAQAFADYMAKNDRF